MTDRRKQVGVAVALVGLTALLALFIRSRTRERTASMPDPVVTEEHDA